MKTGEYACGNKPAVVDSGVDHFEPRRARQPPPAFLPGESHGQRRRRATVPGVAKSQTRLK